MLRNCSPSLKTAWQSTGKLHKSRAKLQDAANAGKSKAQAKAKAGVKELEQLLDSLKDRQTETRTYILQLKRDAQESLKLAQGIGRVKEAVGKALSSRDAKPAAAAKKPAAKAAAKAPAKPPPSPPPKQLRLNPWQQNPWQQNLQQPGRQPSLQRPERLRPNLPPSPQQPNR